MSLLDLMKIRRRRQALYALKSRILERKAYNKAWFKQNPDKRKEYQRRWREKQKLKRGKEA